jgi:hypothetical protein
LEVAHALELSPSAFRIVYTFPYQPASGFAQFYFDPATAGYAAAADIAHRLYAQSAVTLLDCFGIKSLNGQPMLPPANTTTTFAPAPTNYTMPPTTTGTAPSSTTAAPPIMPTIDPSTNILFTAQFLPAYTASRFTSALEDAFEVPPSAFRIVYTVPYQPASGFAQFYFDPTTAGYAAAAEIAHRLYAQSAGTLLAFFDIAALSGQPMLPPVTTSTAPTTTLSPVTPSPTSTVTPAVNILFNATFVLPYFSAQVFAFEVSHVLSVPPSAFRIVYTVPYQPASGFAQFYFDPTTAGYAAAAEIAHRLYAQSTGTLLVFFGIKALSGQPMLPPVTTSTAPTTTLAPVTPSPTSTVTPAVNILFNATFVLPYFSAQVFAFEVSHVLSVPPSAFRIVYTVPYQPASGFAQFYFDPTTAGYAAAADIAHRLYAQSAGTLLVFFGIKALSGQPMLPPVTTSTAPTTTLAPVTPSPTSTVTPAVNILFNATFVLPYFSAQVFAFEVSHVLSVPPSAFRIVYTVPYQPASGFAQFYFDPTTAGYAAAADIAHRLYAQSAGTLLDCFGIKALSGQPMLPPVTTSTAPTTTLAPVTPSPTSTVTPAVNILFNATFVLPYFSAQVFAFEVSHVLSVPPSAFRIVYTVPYQPASGFAQFYFDPTTAGYAAAADIAHRLYAQSTGTLLVFFGIKALSGQPMLPPVTTSTAPTTTLAPVTPSPTSTVTPAVNILFNATFVLPYFSAQVFAFEVSHVLSVPPSAFRIVYTVPYQPASGFAQFYFDPTTAGYAAAADIAHRLYAQSAGTLLDCFGIKALSGQPMLPPVTTSTAPTTTLAPVTPSPTSTVTPAVNILFNATFVLPYFSAQVFAFEVSHMLSVPPSAFRIVYTVPYQPASGFAQFYFDPTTAGYAAAADIAHRLYAQSTGTLLVFFGIKALSGQPMLPPVTTSTAPTTTLAPVTPSPTSTVTPAVNILFNATFVLPYFSAQVFAFEVSHVLSVPPSAFRIVYTVPYQPASGSAQFYFDPTTAGYAAAAGIAHRLYAQSAGTLLVFFGIKALSGQPMLPPVTTSTAPTTTLAPDVTPTNAPSRTHPPSTPQPTAPPPTTAAPSTSPVPPTTVPAATRPYVPSWDNIEFNASFVSPANSSRLQAHVVAWAQVWVGGAAATIQAGQSGPSQQSWHFTGANGTNIGHTFYTQTDDELMDRFGIRSFRVTWIVPQPIEFPPTDNIKFTLTFSSFDVTSFRVGLALLLGISTVDALDLSIDSEELVVNGSQVVGCNFFGPNAVTNAHQLLAMPQSVLATLRITSRSASPIVSPPAAAHDGPRLEWILIGAGCGVMVVAATCAGCALRKKRWLCCRHSDGNESDMDTIIGDDSAVNRLLN